MKKGIILIVLVFVSLCCYAFMGCKKGDNKFKYAYIQNAFSQASYVNFITGTTAKKEISQSFWADVVLNKKIESVEVTGFETTGNHVITCELHQDYPYELFESKNGHYVYRFVIVANVLPQTASENDVVGITKLFLKINDNYVELLGRTYYISVYYAQSDDVSSTIIAYNAMSLGKDIGVDFMGRERVRITEIAMSDKVISLTESKVGLDMLVPKDSSNQIQLAFDVEEQNVYRCYDHLVIKYVLDGSDVEHMIGTGRVSFENWQSYDDFIKQLNW